MVLVCTYLQCIKWHRGTPSRYVRPFPFASHPLPSQQCMQHSHSHNSPAIHMPTHQTDCPHSRPAIHTVVRLSTLQPGPSKQLPGPSRACQPRPSRQLPGPSRQLPWPSPQQTRPPLDASAQARTIWLRRGCRR